jgi:hypothetical protein
MYVAVGAVSFYGLLLTQGHADDLLEDVGQDVRGCTLTETQKSEALTSHVRERGRESGRERLTETLHYQVA